MKTIQFLLIAGITVFSFACNKDCHKPPVNEDCFTWDKVLGGNLSDKATLSVKTPDNGYIIAGSVDNNPANICVIKVNSKGEQLWKKLLGGREGKGAYTIVAAHDGGYVIFGYQANDDADMLAIKVDENGNELWRHSWGGIGPQEISSGVATQNGYVVSAVVQDSNSNVDTYIIKLDLQGNVVSQNKIINPNHTTDTRKILLTADGGYLLSGYITDYISLNPDAWVAKIDAAGTIIWQKTFSGSRNDLFSDAIADKDGGWILLGETRSNDGDMLGNHSTIDKNDAILIKIDAQGNKVWQNFIGGLNDDFGQKIISTGNGNYLVLVITDSNDGSFSGNHGGRDALLSEMTPSGSVIKQQLLGGTKDDYAIDLIQASPCTYLITGYSYSNDGDIPGNNGGSDFWLSKRSF